MAKQSEFSNLSALQNAMADGNLDAAREALFALTPDEKAALEDELGTETVQLLLRSARKRRRAKHGRVIVINGIMGALLDSVDSVGIADRIWIDFKKIFAGRIAELKLTLAGLPTKPKVKIKLAGLHKSYLALALELNTSWDVLQFPFDWRIDLDKSAERLAAKITEWGNGEPIHIVAHSMGGLLSRRFIQLFPDIWTSMADPQNLQRGGRLIMLGTPNKGSYAVPLILSGKEKIVKWIAFADFKHSLKRLLTITNTFPGSYQMLPSPHLDLDDDHAKLFEIKSWGTLPVIKQHLKKGLDFQSSIQNIIEPDRMIYVAGYDQKTPYRIQIKRPGVFRYKQTWDGDGRVPHELGLLKDVPTFWVREVHGNLPKNEQVLAGIHELLRTGQTSELPRQKPERRKIEKAEEWLEPEDLVIESEELLNFEEKIKSLSRSPSPQSKLTDKEALRLNALVLDEYLGTVAVHSKKSDSDSNKVGDRGKTNNQIPKLFVEVIWDDITKAKGDVYCVGHYEGVLPLAAEKALEKVVSSTDTEHEEGLLTRLTKRGILRGALGEINFYPWAGSGNRGRIVAVAGMGPPGNFNARDLRHLGQRLAFAIGSLPDAKTACTVLIGSGKGGLPLEESVLCLLQGLSDAIDDGLTSPIKRLRIVEYQLGKAWQIQKALQDIKKQENFNFSMSLRGKVINGQHGGLSDEYSLALALASTAEAASARSDSARNKALSTLLRKLPLPESNKNKIVQALESMGKIVGDTEILQFSSRLSIGDRKNLEEDKSSPTRISFVKDHKAIAVAAINHSTVVSKRHLSSDFGLVLDTIARTTDPDPEQENIAELSAILYERLVPKDFKDCVKKAEPLIIEVDREMANVHWEFLPRSLDFKNNNTELFKSIISLSVPLSRQLRTSYSPPPMPVRQARAHPRALVIGDPGDPRAGDNLPGAQLEAECVSKILKQKGFEVETRIGAPTGRNRGPIQGVLPASRLDVLHLINSGQFDLMHYAGHGDFDADDPSRVGWLFKDGLITAAELENMDHAPQIVVANACLSARTSTALRGGRRMNDNPDEIGLLPSLADEFFRRGVYNYIGTAWEVDDEGAVLFAETFYEKFLPDLGSGNAGLSIGEAVRIARVKLFNESDRYGSLWAAYQHYGDPNLEF